MIKNRKDFYNSLTEEEQKEGWIRLYVPADKTIPNAGTEHVWGWADETERVKYRNPNYTGTMTVILLSYPINFMGKLKAGDEVVLDVLADMEEPYISKTWLVKELGETCKL